MKKTVKQLIGYQSLEGWWLKRQHFDAEVLAHIAERIRKSESSHTGELVVAIEAISPKHEDDPRVRALEVYGRLRVWDTPLNSGVLLYIALDKRAIEIIADRGISAAQTDWQQVCSALQAEFEHADYIQGLLNTVDHIERILKLHAPAGDTSADVLANEPVLL